MLTTALVSAVLAMSTPTPDHQITYINRAYYAPQQVQHNYELGDNATTQVVSTIPADKEATDPWSTRQAMGGQDAPDWIVIRHRDGLFAIDPFVPLPEATPEASRQLFKAMEYGTDAPAVTLDTDRSQYGRRRIVRTEELFRVLEAQRIQWLKAKGFIGGVTSLNGDANQSLTRRTPRALPEDMPRTRPVESVQANPARPLILSGDQPVRISLPDLGVSKAVRDRVAARGNVISKPLQTAELLKDEVKTDSVKQ